MLELEIETLLANDDLLLLTVWKAKNEPRCHLEWARLRLFNSWHSIAGIL